MEFYEYLAFTESLIYHLIDLEVIHILNSELQYMECFVGFCIFLYFLLLSILTAFLCTSSVSLAMLMTLSLDTEVWPDEEVEEKGE